jgi:ADP-sugar diphosphatase
MEPSIWMSSELSYHYFWSYENNQVGFFAEVSCELSQGFCLKNKVAEFSVAFNCTLALVNTSRQCFLAGVLTNFYLWRNSMTDLNLTHTVAGIPVTAAEGLDPNVATSSKLFTDWLASVDRQRFILKSVHIQSIDMFGPRVGFLKFKVDVVDVQTKFLPGVVFARGGSVTVLVVLVCEGEAHAVVTVQPRLATGSFDFVELCAGMLDGSGNFAGVAAKELKEELGIEVKEEDLTDLSTLSGHPGGVYLSPGACEETIRFYALCQSVTREELEAMEGRCTGVLEEGEQITLKIVPLDSLVTIADAKTIVAHSLFQRFSREIPGTQAIKG